MADVAIIIYVSVFWSKNCFPFQSFSSPFHLPNMAVGHRRSLRHPHADGGEIRTLGAVFSSWLLLTLAEVNSSPWLWDICLGIAGLSCLFYMPHPPCSIAWQTCQPRPQPTSTSTVGHTGAMDSHPCHTQPMGNLVGVGCNISAPPAQVPSLSFPTLLPQVPVIQLFTHPIFIEYLLDIRHYFRC